MAQSFYGGHGPAPLGRMVEIDGGYMHVYSEGQGAQTCVFLSGGGTCSPVLDFKPLYTRLSGKYRICVVEKFGYGFSDIHDSPRDIATILRQTREALFAAGEKPPYLLLPHSMSGIEAIYWAQQYPAEVAGIVGLDPAVPETYEKYPIPSGAAVRILHTLVRAGALHLLPFLANQTAALQCGGLTTEEQRLYKYLFCRRTFTKPMVREIHSILQSARLVAAGGVPQNTRMLFFASNAEGTGVSKEVWHNTLREYIGKTQGGTFIELDCGHYVHDFMPEEIAQKIKDFA